ncbi:DUF742 domain-containing protein [Streptomyces avicenniae]|uniref:DUF742 domain-containing protein n=1 Tax=Streptomyces avicenniae TaxID=500153 RepID=UPI00069A9D35|nr:DUF742 domain-containing protein [Streptomyces avicenniae]
MSRRLIPAYLWTGGRTHPSRNVLDRLTVLRAATDHLPSDLTSSGRSVLEILQHGALPLAEVAAHLEMPVIFVKVLVSDLFDQGLLIVRAPAPVESDAKPDQQLLERVIRGLRALQ